MQVFAGTSSCRAGYPDHITRMHPCALSNQHPGKVAIADDIIAVPHGDILAGGLILPHLHNHPLHHRQRLIAASVQVDTSMKPFLTGERISAITVRGCDLDNRKRI